MWALSPVWAGRLGSLQVGSRRHPGSHRGGDGGAQCGARSDPPITDDAPAGGQGAFVRFQHGDVYWSQATGSQLVRGNILATWLATGGATGGLGFPTRSSYAVTGSMRTDFERGRMTWNAKTAAVSVSR